MKALITGGAGFIGSHLTDYLLGQGHEVFVIDDLSTGRKENMAGSLNHPQFTFKEASVIERGVVQPVMERVDVVYHLAASVGVRRIVNDLVDSIENTIKASEVVLELAAQHGRRVLLTSTSEVYGRSVDGKPFTEEDDLRMGPTLKSRWSYACSKALDEYLAFAYHQERGLPVTVVRLFNTVGERQIDSYGMVLPTFVKQALAGKPLTVYGTGQQSRCFTHVSDVVRGLSDLMEHPETVGEVYNLGSREEITIDALADRVLALLAPAGTKEYISYEDAYPITFEDIDRRVPNADKIHALLGWEPTLGIDETIKRVAEAEVVPAPTN